MFDFGAITTGLVVAVLLTISGIKILKEYERAVIFRLGRLVKARGPGIIYVIPWVEKMMRVGLRTVTMDVPPQDVITRDNVSIKVSAVLYFRVIEPNRAITEVQNYLFASSQLAQVTLRSTCGQALLDELLAEREKINTRIQEILDAQTEPWGIKVVLVEVKDIDLPPDMQRAMAKQAEAERERGVQKSFMRRENFKPLRSWRMQPKSSRNTLRPCTSDSCKVSLRYPRKIIPP